MFLTRLCSEDIRRLSASTTSEGGSPRLYFTTVPIKIRHSGSLTTHWKNQKEREVKERRESGVFMYISCTAVVIALGRLGLPGLVQ